MNKKLIIISLLILVLVSVQFVSAADNNTETDILEDNGDNEILSAPSETKTYTDLKTVIDNANDGDNITLEYNYQYNSGTDSSIRTGITIDKNLVINGNGATIDGASASSLFNISEGVTVTLKNLTIKNCAAHINPGWPDYVEYNFHAINSQGKLNIYDCTFDSNQLADEWSSTFPLLNGTVINSTNDIYIENSKFIKNYVQCCGVIYTTGQVSLKGSTFQENKAYKQSKGGVIYAGSIDMIDNCTFNSNTIKEGNGSAIYIANSDCVTTIVNSTFTSNTVTSGYGGAVYTEGSVDSIVNSSFNSNYAKYNGGAVYIGNSDSVTAIENSTFESNSASSGNGGAIYTQGNINSIINSSFDVNNALEGGAIYAKGITSIDNTSLDTNGVDSKSVGGAIYLTGDSNLLINNSHIDDNLGEFGAGIYTHGSVTVVNSNLTKKLCT